MMFKTLDKVAKKYNQVKNLVKDVQHLIKATSDLADAYQVLNKIVQANNECICELYDLYDRLAGSHLDSYEDIGPAAEQSDKKLLN